MPLLIAESQLPPEIRRKLPKPKKTDLRSSGGSGERIFVLDSKKEENKKWFYFKTPKKIGVFLFKIWLFDKNNI